jgi:CO/xanthine dehydrogenase Mo-binding subunit
MAGLDPVAMRRINLREPGAPGPLGQAVAPSERLIEMLDGAAASPMWRQPRGVVGDEVVGVGLALNHQGNGLGSFFPDPGGCRLTLTPEGRIEAAFGMDEMGQGLVAAVPAAVADVLGCGRGDIDTLLGDTHLTPESGSTSAARGIHIVWRAAALAGEAFAAKVRAAAGALLARPAEELALAPGGVRDARSNSGELLLTFADLATRLAAGDLPTATCAFEFPKTQHARGNARFIFAFGAALARVAVDRVTGAVRVLDFEQHTAAGPIVDAAAYLGQIEGGGVQGIGFTLSEDAVMRDGRFVTGNFDLYMMPGVADVPRDMAVFAHEGLDPDDPHGPRGVGEIGIGAVTPAIAAAIADALGSWPVVTPIPPETMLDAVEKAEAAS